MKKEPFDVGQPFSCGYLLCFDPTPLHTLKELRAWTKELLSMDQSHPDVIDALADVNAVIKEKEDT